MLEVTNLNAYYGKSHILRGVNMNVAAGEIVSLLGRNGVGRSTTCKAIMGEVPPQGSVMFKGQEIAGRKAFEIAKLGVGYVPENRDIFPGLTTRQTIHATRGSQKIDVLLGCRLVVQCHEHPFCLRGQHIDRIVPVLPVGVACTHGP